MCVPLSVSMSLRLLLFLSVYNIVYDPRYCSVVSTEDEKPSAPCTYAVGEMIKVWYGKGKFLKQYIAKVNCIDCNIMCTLHVYMCTAYAPCS